MLARNTTIRIQASQFRLGSGMMTACLIGILTLGISTPSEAEEFKTMDADDAYQVTRGLYIMTPTVN